MNLNRVDELLALHLAETTEGLVEGPPSALGRGEGTERNFYVLKVDLVGSTQLLWNRRQVTYMRLAHTFLSTVDRITQEYGADSDQVEYAGDGLMAYFPERVESAAILECAFYANAAVHRIAGLGGTVGSLRPRCRMVVHYTPLTVARIGPRAASVLSAIGWPLHRISKLEKEIRPGVGRATTEYVQRLPRDLRKYLIPIYKEEQELVPAPATFSFHSPGDSLFSRGLGFGDPARNMLLESLFPSAARAPTPAPAPQYRTKRELIGYDINWQLLGTVLK